MSSLFSRLSATGRGIVWMIGCAFFFSVMNNLIRLTAEDLPILQMVFLRNLFACLLVFPFVLMGAQPLFKGFQARTYGWRTLFSWLSMMTWFYSLTIMPISQATALSFTTPLFISLLVILFMGERADPFRLGAILVGFLGSLIIIRPGYSVFDSHSLIVLGGSFLMAVSATLVKHLTRHDSALMILFYMTLIMTPLSLPLAVLNWQTLTLHGLLMVLSVAATSSVGHYCMNKAYAACDVTVVLPFDFFRLLFTSVLAYLIFQEIPDGWTYAGALVILMGAVAVTYRETRTKAAVEAEQVVTP